MINTYIYNISSNTQNQEICEAFSDAWAFNASSSSSGGSNADVLQAQRLNLLKYGLVTSCFL